MRRDINTRLTRRIEAQKDISLLIRTSGVKEKKLSEGKEPSTGHLFRILTRNTSFISNQATSPLITRTRNTSKRIINTKTNYL